MSGGALVCDNGTGYLKLGWSTDNFPQYSFPCMVGRPHPHFAELVDATLDPNSEFVGEEVLPRRAALQIFRPMEEGIVKDWENMTKIWSAAFQQIGVDYSGTDLLVTEAPMNPRRNKEQLAQVMFETFGFRRFRVEVQAVLSLYAVGLMSGLVIDSGDGVSHCIPVTDGVIQQHGINRINLAGRHLTDYFMTLLQRRGYNFHSSADFETVREIKEKLCYVSKDIKEDRDLAQNTTIIESDYQLPDGNWIKVGRERFEAPEALFNPHVAGLETDGISEIIFKAIMDSPMDSRASLFRSIVLSGGSTMYPGFSSRVEADIKAKHREMRGTAQKSRVQIMVHDPPTRKYSVFIGGATLARIYSTTSQNYWITRSEWNEQGNRIFDFK